MLLFVGYELLQVVHDTLIQNPSPSHSDSLRTYPQSGIPRHPSIQSRGVRHIPDNDGSMTDKSGPCSNHNALRTVRNSTHHTTCTCLNSERSRCSTVSHRNRTDTTPPQTPRQNKCGRRSRRQSQTCRSSSVADIQLMRNIQKKMIENEMLIPRQLARLVEVNAQHWHGKPAQCTRSVCGFMPCCRSKARNVRTLS